MSHPKHALSSLKKGTSKTSCGSSKRYLTSCYYEALIITNNNDNNNSNNFTTYTAQNALNYTRNFNMEVGADVRA